jgi:hypothetical protein
MNAVETVLFENINKPNSCFIFPTDIAASRWADHLLRLRGGTVAMNKFIAWDVFKQNSIKSKVKNKKSIPSALRKIFVSRLIRENAENCAQGKTPVFFSLIRVQWAGQAGHFTSWITGILPQLGSWLNKTVGLQTDNILDERADKAFSVLEGDDRDMFILARRYAQFLEKYGLFEPAWETPPFNDDGTEYFIFFPEALSDFCEYRELLAASGHVRIINAPNTENMPFDTFFYTNARSEITEAALYIRALNENMAVKWDSICVCIPDSENYEPYVMREFSNRNIPFVKRTSKPLADYHAGRFFRSVLDCVSQNFSFPAVVSLALNRNLPWKDTAQINSLMEFGINNNCISSWTEEKDGKEMMINVWEDAFKKPLGGIDPYAVQFFNDFKKRLISLRTSGSFSEIRKNYFIFREQFFDMEKCTDETDLTLSRCISELVYLCEIEKNFPDTPAVDPFLFYTEYLSEVNYLAQTQACGVNILPYKTAAAAPFDCHIVLGAAQNNLSVIYSRLDFLPRKKREELGIFDEDASDAFINLHKYNSLKNAAFFCSKQTFSGFTIPHSKINALSDPADRYATQPSLKEKFSPDYYSAESLVKTDETENSIPLKLHENQIDGFENWKHRRKTAETGGEKWHTGKNLLELIRKKFSYDKNRPDKYSVSASSLTSYYQCSLKWLYERVLNLENVQIEASLTEENITGMLYHAALNLFFSELKEKKQPLSAPYYSELEPALPENYRLLLENCVEAVFSGEKTQMSALTARLMRAGKKYLCFHLENCIAHFLSFFSGCYITGSETSYQSERDKYFLNGKLDLILKAESEISEKEYIIADFKLKRTPVRSDCTGEGENGLSDFQLPMYITLCEENEKIKVHNALFYSILEFKPEVIIGTVTDKFVQITIPKKEGDRILRNSENFDNIINEFNVKAERFAKEISTGGFTVFESKYNNCSSCNFNRICRTVYIINRGNING